MRSTSWNTARWWTARASPVSRPVDWVFRCLSKDGTYRIPTGYVSPAELRRPGTRRRPCAGNARHWRPSRRLLEEEAALPLEKEVEAMFRQMLAEPDGRLPHRSWRRFPPSCVRAGGWKTRWCRRPAGCRSAICSRTPSERGSRAILCVHSVRICSMDILGG